MADRIIPFPRRHASQTSGAGGVGLSAEFRRGVEFADAENAAHIAELVDQKGRAIAETAAERQSRIDAEAQASGVRDAARTNRMQLETIIVMSLCTAGLTIIALSQTDPSIQTLGWATLTGGMARVLWAIRGYSRKASDPSGPISNI